MRLLSFKRAGHKLGTKGVKAAQVRAVHRSLTTDISGVLRSGSGEGAAFGAAVGAAVTVGARTTPAQPNLLAQESDLVRVSGSDGAGR